MAVIDDNANVIERIDLNPYGEARHHWKADADADADGDGDHDTTDRNLIDALTGGGGTPITSANYNVDCDLDRNGIINSTDYSLSCGSMRGWPRLGGLQHQLTRTNRKRSQESVRALRPDYNERT